MAETYFRHGPVNGPGESLAAGLKRAVRSKKWPWITPPSSRAVDGVLQWIDEAQRLQQKWAGEALIAVGILVLLLLLGLSTGVLHE
jgi:hypothetical protein